MHVLCVTISTTTEYLLETDIRRLSIAQEHSVRTRITLAELLDSYVMDARLECERSGTDKAIRKSEPDSVHRLIRMDWSKRLKDKQEMIRDAVQTKLQQRLEEEFNQESESLQSEVAITNDTSEHTSAGDSSAPARVFFTTIQGRLKTAHSNPPHLNWDQWHAVYRGQPWLAIQAQHITAMK
eukprot:14887-Heterococcus_DN1.PRE.7